MQTIENSIVKEKMYIEKMPNGLTVKIIPKSNTNKKYAIIGTHFGSIDNNFIVPGNTEPTKIPDGVAHFLEHKMFEQENGRNSLDVFTDLGVDANAYTTNDHTAYLFEATNNFEKAFDELMDYVQHPYFTDENVEKEKGIIVQEINMYLDDPGTKVYMEALKCMYNDNPVRIDVAGDEPSVRSITKEILYDCYNTFYSPSNMVLVLCGDFEPEKTIELVKSKLVDRPIQGEIKRIYPEEKKEIKTKEAENSMDISQPIFVIGIKGNSEEKVTVKKSFAIDILLQILLGKSSELYKKLYENQDLIIAPDLDYEFADNYEHIAISGQAKDPKKIYEEVKNKITEIKQKGINEEEFQRIKKKVYGSYIMDYNDVSTIARMFLADSMKGINSFDYLEEYENLTLEYANQIFKEEFDLDKMVISIIK